ncbi:MAG TPA: acyl-CoA dehydrogenase [Acidimicrobiales bacterium]|nr:acyl-CoA dehydrogenase [Acidimicrobiales bacterium]
MSELGPQAPYRPPVEEIVLDLETAGLERLLELEAYAGIDLELVRQTLGELGRFVTEVIAPTDRPGDLEGARFDPASGQVVVPEALRRAYRRYVDAGWGSLQFPAEHGGGGLPGAAGLAMQEMLAAANLSLSLNPVLTQGAVELLLAWGTPSQQARFVPRLVTGEWCGTMNLTEPEAGSDLGAVSTRAEPAGDGTWRVFGTKIFITWGEHDLADNIVHLVLARAPGAPPGTRGLSLFLVPKRLLTADGAAGAPNALRCVRLEHKLGLHASPTCVMSYEGALGELVGTEHGGMQAMFTMMNRARLAIGVEGPAVAERAYQQALAYALERRQGRAGDAASGSSPLAEHPDVRRMLLTMRTSLLAARLLLYSAAVERDLARHAADRHAREQAQDLVDLLTPVAKAWATDRGVDAASLGIQVLGGIGYVEESGMPQRLRDVRIAPIYEGTNGIQAIDLVTRKLDRRSGATIMDLLGRIAGLVAQAREQPGGAAIVTSLEVLAEAHETLAASTSWLLEALPGRREDALAGASAYLDLLGTTLGGWLLARRALTVSGRDDHAGQRAAAESNFYALELLSRATGLRRAIMIGAATLAAPFAAGEASAGPRRRAESGG